MKNWGSKLRRTVWRQRNSVSIHTRFFVTETLQCTPLLLKSRKKGDSDLFATEDYFIRKFYLSLFHSLLHRKLTSQSNGGELVLGSPSAILCTWWGKQWWKKCTGLLILLSWVRVPPAAKCLNLTFGNRKFELDKKLISDPREKKTLSDPLTNGRA